MKPMHLINQSLFITVLLISLPSLIHAQRDIPVDAFDGISVIGNIDVTLEAGSGNTISLYAEGIPEEDISIKVSRGILRLKVLNSWLYKNEIIRVYIPYEKIHLIRGDAGAQIRGKDLLVAEQMEVRIGSGATAELELEVDRLEASANEGGRLTLMGKASSQDVGVGTGGIYDAFDLDCARTYVRAGTGGEAEVVATQLLEASANTGGSIYYKGNPKEKRIKTFIAGEVAPF